MNIFYLFLILGILFYLIYILITSSYYKKIYEKFSNWKIPVHQINYIDNDIVTIDNINKKDCLKICEEDNICAGFVYIPRDDKCIFKSKLEKPVFEHGHITYSKE